MAKMNLPECVEKAEVLPANFGIGSAWNSLQYVLTTVRRLFLFLCIPVIDNYNMRISFLLYLSFHWYEI